MSVNSQVSRVDIEKYEEKQVGRNVKSSKVEYIWRFWVRGRCREAKIVRSYYSGKLRLFIDGVLVYQDLK